jgi:predicted nucleic-acid-binding Zn-ribbon protein
MIPDYRYTRSEQKQRRCTCGEPFSIEKCQEKNMVRVYCKKCGTTTPWERDLWNASLAWEKQIIQPVGHK